MRREAELLKREERLENVERINKANQYAAAKVKEKIELDKKRGEDLQREKERALQTRFAVRRQADAQKREMLAKVEQLKKRGKISHNDLALLGLGSPNNAET